MEIKFLGATETVTGSRHLLITDRNSQILLDCGLYQGLGKQTDELNRYLKLDPKEIEAVVLSHAHIDHSGNLPLLVKQGFTGKIYCTPGTRDVCELLLRDSAHIHEVEIVYVNRRRKRDGEPMLEPLYSLQDAEKCLTHFETVDYNQNFKINDEVEITFTESGHILGSAAINLSLTKPNGKKISLSYTGDIGRYNDLLLRDPEPLLASDYVICESTYGNRLHDKRENDIRNLIQTVKSTCVEKKGRLIIPAFSLGRTQEIVYRLNLLFNKGMLPKIKIYVDSPLSTSATRVTLKNKRSLNDCVQEILNTDPDPFGFEGLKYITDVEDSKLINMSDEPCIIISSSGMMDAGRIKHHLRHNLPNVKNTIFIVGYCSPNSLGDKLIRGDKQVKIFGEFVSVNAEISVQSSYSAHADYEEMLKYLSSLEKSKIKTIFLVHGEQKVKEDFKQILETNGYLKIVIPNKLEKFTLH